MNSIQKLLAGAVDYAGLFPPASLSMLETVANYARYRAEPVRGMLGRLVIPTARLDELRTTVESMEFESRTMPLSPWCISALVPASAAIDYDDFRQALTKIEEFNRLYACASLSPLLVDSIEVKADGADDLRRLSELQPSNLDCYFEIDCQSDPTELLETLARISGHSIISNGNSGSGVKSTDVTTPMNASRRFAKIRTGSVVANQIPSIEQVSRFIAACARDYVPFKATAGLHHPIRSEYRLTYEPNADCGTMHGFLNMFVATLCAFEYQLNEQEISQILNEREAHNFHFEDDRIQWHHLTIGIDRIDTLRSKSIQSFGSCSFVEPTTELSERYQCQLS